MSQTDDVQFYSDASCSVDVLSPVVDIAGYDASSPKIICVAVNPKGDFNGSDGSNEPSFTIKFIVRVDWFLSSDSADDGTQGMIKGWMVRYNARTIFFEFLSKFLCILLDHFYPFAVD